MRNSPLMCLVIYCLFLYSSGEKKLVLSVQLRGVSFSGKMAF